MLIKNIYKVKKIAVHMKQLLPEKIVILSLISSSFEFLNVVTKFQFRI